MYESDQRTVADVEAKARELGRKVRYPKSNELFIDIDSAEQFAKHQRAFNVLASREECEREIGPSPSGKPGHYHITVTLRRTVDDLERVMLQACLGSDPAREMLGYFRHEDGSDPAAISVFFEAL